MPLSDENRQLISQARAAHAKAMRQSDIAEDGAWVASEGWHEPPGSQYWHVTATRRPTKAGVEPFDVSKAMTRDPAVAALLTFVSTALPQLCNLAERAEAALSRATQAEELVREVVGVLEDIADAPKLPKVHRWAGQDAAEDLFDMGLRHKSGLKPYDYLKTWLGMLRPFAYATQDDSWGEMEKLLCIVMRNYVRMIAKAEATAPVIAKLKAAPLQGDGSSSASSTEHSPSGRTSAPSSTGGGEP